MAHEKRLLIDVFQAYFYRRNEQGDRELVFMSENLTSGGVVTSQENTDVRNGQGNTLFAILPGTKDVTVNLTENVFSFEALQLNSGGKKSAGTATGNSGLMMKRAGRFTTEELEVDIQANGTPTGDYARFKLKYVPENQNEVKVSIGGQDLTYKATTGDVDDDTKFTLTLKDGTIYNGTNATVGTDDVYVLIRKTAGQELQTKKDLKILPYVYITKQDGTSTLTIDVREFSEGGELWLQTVEKDEKQKAVAYVYFVFDNAMPEGNFEINTVSEVQPNDMTVNMRILANENGELYRIIREEI